MSEQIKDYNNEENENELLIELNTNRKKLYEMIDSLTEFRKNLSDLLPKQMDYKNKWIISERVKTVTNTIECELKVRKQIDENIKQVNDMNNKEKTENEIDVSIISKLLQQNYSDEKTEEDEYVLNHNYKEFFDEPDNSSANNKIKNYNTITSG